MSPVMQETCGNCKAFLQPEWTKCKICGQEVVADDPVPDVGDAPTGRGRRSKKPKSPRAAAPGAPRATSGSPTSGSRSLHVVLGVLLVVTLGAVAFFALSGDDDGAADDDRPAGESTEEERAAVEALGEWDVTQLPQGVSIELPAPALQQDVTVQVLGVGRIEMAQAQVIEDGRTYIFAGGALPTSVSHLDPDQILLGAVDGVADSVGGTVEATKAVTVDGNPALRARIAARGGRETRMASTIVDGRLFILQVNSAADEELDPVYLQRMIDTFQG
jgi:hypothetical protein